MASTDRLIEVFNEAKVRSAGSERDGYLTEACKDDAELKTQILSLIQAHECAGKFFLAARPALPPMIEAEMARLRPERAGGRIGPYTLREQIGEGGFGTVWVAEQQLPVRRTVALKIIKMGMDTKEVVARFEQERQALAMMEHPSIARVFDAGATEEGRPYFVMELVRGIRITDYCDHASLPTPERLALFMQVCHAVQHAHQKGIIHRDLKPSNILVTLQDGIPVPKVIDFGVAKATQGPLTALTIHTRALEMVGTPLYMSPEQAEMKGLDVDTRTDIYALGVLLYELLTGRTPFDADALRKAGYDEVRRIIREQEPQKPSTALHTMAQGTLTSIAQHRASEPPKLIHAIRGDLDWIVMKTLEKERARRYDTANGLAADIRRHLENEPVTARPPSRAYQFRKLVVRNKLAFSAAGAIAAVLFIGVTTATWMYLRERDARQRATVAEELATERLAEAEAVSTFMTEVFHSPDPARDGRTITVAETLDRAVKKLETDLADQPARRNSLLVALGNTYQALGLHRQAIPIREKTLEYRRTVFDPEHPKMLTAMHSLALSYAAVDRWEEALKLREDVVEIRRKNLSPEHPDMLGAMGSLADSYLKSGRLEEALRLREELLPLFRKVSGPEHIATFWAMQNLANSYASAGRPDEAFKLREEVLPLCRKVLGPEHPTTLMSMHYLADSQWETGQRDEARKLREETLPLRRKVLGPEHPETLWTMNNLANSYFNAGRRDEALKLREETLSLRRKVLGPEHPFTLWSMHSLSDSYHNTGRRDEARKLREEVLTLRRKVLGPEHPHTLWIMNDLANSYLQVGRTAEALPLLADASSRKPDDTVLATKVATLQVWFAREADYSATCQRMLKWTANSGNHQAAQHVAKFSCLRPMNDASMQQAALALARRAVELRHGNPGLSPWHQMTLGMAEYRSGQYPAADEALTTASKTASATGGYRPYVVKSTASFYRAMSLFQQGRQAEARELFTAAEAKMNPLPADEKNPLADGKSDHDDLILWLACKEARALLNVLPAGKP